jgi:hypothetical protein
MRIARTSRYRWLPTRIDDFGKCRQGCLKSQHDDWALSWLPAGGCTAGVLSDLRLSSAPADVAAGEPVL